MLLSEVTGVGAAPAEPERNVNAELGREDFLRMLIAQLENQDPINPQEATEFSAQLAQFSSLEQLISMRAGIEELSAQAGRSSGSDALAALGMIGREVLAVGSQLELAGEGAAVPPLVFDLEGAADQVRVDIIDPGGSLRRTLELGPRASGRVEVAWDGRDVLDAPLESGVYSYRVTASAEGESVPATPLLRTRVTGATLSGESPLLFAGPLVVPLADVREVREPGAREDTP